MPDVVALAAVVSQDGTVHIANNVGAFATATVNLGAAGTITASVDTGSAALPLALPLCETNPSNGQRLAAPASSVTFNDPTNATPTFSIFALSSGSIPFSPGSSRIFVRFKDAQGVSHGSTSVAVTTN